MMKRWTVGVGFAALILAAAGYWLYLSQKKVARSAPRSAGTGEPSCLSPTTACLVRTPTTT